MVAVLTGNSSFPKFFTSIVGVEERCGGGGGGEGDLDLGNFDLWRGGGEHTEI